MPRIIKFTAKDVAADDEDFALTAGFARDGSDEDTDDGLMLQRAKEDESDDEGIYVEVPIQRHACYGGVAEATLRVGHFSISFTPESTRRLGDIAGMEISFTVSPEQFEQLAAILHRIFREHEGFTVEKG